MCQRNQKKINCRPAIRLPDKLYQFTDDEWTDATQSQHQSRRADNAVEKHGPGTWSLQRYIVRDISRRYITEQIAAGDYVTAATCLQCCSARAFWCRRQTLVCRSLCSFQ